MGGISEKSIAKLRVHINNGDIHLHDDQRNLVFSSDLEEFKTDIKEIFKTFEEEDGIAQIDGTEDTLCLLQKGSNFYAFILDKNIKDNKIKKELEEYIEAN